MPDRVAYDVSDDDMDAEEVAALQMTQADLVAMVGLGKPADIVRSHRAGFVIKGDLVVSELHVRRTGGVKIPG